MLPLVAGLLALPLLALACGGDQADGAPNILLILTDDQRYDTVGEYMPEVQSRIFDQGITFENAFVTTPLCCPSRASILTGMYAHKHGVQTNEHDLTQATFVHRLHDAGYFTGQVGKYLNSWDSSPRPEFDFWAAMLPFAPTPYFNTDINVNGVWTRSPYYTTRVYQRYAIDFLHEAETRGEPFLLILAPNAPHGPALPAPDHENLYSDLRPYRPPNYNEADVSDKPLWLRNRPPMSAAQQAALDRARDNLRLKQLRSLKSVDLAVAAVLDRLEEQGGLDDTLVIYTSDNGLFWGEHGLDGKELVYEPSIRVPLALRYPKALPEGRVEEALVANIDIAPTIYELAGVPIPSEVDGRSLLSLQKDRSSWRTELLIEGWPPMVQAPTLQYTALRTERYVYVENKDDLPELYDLREDPYQMENRATDRAFAPILSELRGRLRELVDAPEADPATTPSS